MPEEVLFKSERRQSRAEVADYLRTVADKLDAGGSISMSTGSDSVTLDVPDRPTFEVKAEREGTAPNTELSIEFELEWKENGGGGGGGGDLTIE
jgi:amphi-Trp domain-containing protein